MKKLLLASLFTVTVLSLNAKKIVINPETIRQTESMIALIEQNANQTKDERTAVFTDLFQKASLSLDLLDDPQGISTAILQKLESITYQETASKIVLVPQFMRYQLIQMVEPIVQMLNSSEQEVQEALEEIKLLITELQALEKNGNHSYSAFLTKLRNFLPLAHREINQIKIIQHTTAAQLRAFNS